MSNFRTRCRRCRYFYWFGIIGTTLIHPPHYCPAIVLHFELVGGDEDE